MWTFCSSARLFMLFLVIFISTSLILVREANADPISVCSGSGGTGTFTTTLGGEAGGGWSSSARCVGNQVSGMGAISSFSYDLAYNAGTVTWAEAMILDYADARQLASVNITALLPTVYTGSFSTTTATFPYLTPLDPTRTYFLAFCQRLGNGAFAYATNINDNGPGALCFSGSIDTCLASTGSWLTTYSAKSVTQGTCSVPTPSPSRTPSPTSSPTSTPSTTPSISVSPTRSPTPSVSVSNSPTSSPTPSTTPTTTPSASSSPTSSPSPTTTPSASPSPQDMNSGSRLSAWWWSAALSECVV